ncbi:MAG TPA: ATPase domain-containing protein [Longimicrobiales bacterium]|nr:ATPase domain-containing protein [Longimicrobiales bacterium]
MPTFDILRTGVPGLDTVLGGGLPAGSFNVVGGDPGAGKTTLAHQILFANATEERPALFCTLVGEPPIKMLRYQQQFDFFDVERVGSAIHYMNLHGEVLEGDLDGVFDALVEEVERLEPAFVVVDSFRSVTAQARLESRAPSSRLRSFVQRLSNAMTRWETTSFLLGEFRTEETPNNPLFTIADGVFWLRQQPQGDTRVRKLTVSKLRGAAELAGQHVYRISSAGLRVYPRAFRDLDDPVHDTADRTRMATGVEGLDEMLDGGFVRGDAVIVSGPSGTGKSVLGMHFAGAGLDAGENVVVATFEENVDRFIDRAALLGNDFRSAVAENRLSLFHRRPLDLSVDETFEEILDRVDEIRASRVVIDSLSGLQVAASGTEAERLRESMGRLVQTLTTAGVTVMMTAELSQQVDQLRFTPHDSSFLADDVVLLRYVEVRGRLKTVMSVVKMRRSAHTRAFHHYEIGAEGIAVGRALENFHGILTGVPEITGDAEP